MTRPLPDGCVEREAHLATHLTDATAWAAVAAMHDHRGDLEIADEAWAEAWRLSDGDMVHTCLKPYLDDIRPAAERYLALRALEPDWAPGPLLGLWRQLLRVTGDREEWLAAVERLRPRVRLDAGLADDLPRAARLALAALAATRLRVEHLDDRLLASALGSERHHRRAEHHMARLGASAPPALDESALTALTERAEALYSALAADYRRGIIALCAQS